MIGRSLGAVVAFLIVSMCGVTVASAASASAYDRLQTLARDMTFRWAKLHPLNATELGIAGEDGQLDTPSAAEDERDLALIRDWEAQLSAIPVANEALTVRDDAALLRAQLLGMERQYTVYRTDRRDYSGPGNAITNTIFTQFQHLPVSGGREELLKAWGDIIARLEAAPAYIRAGESLVTEPGHLQGVVGADELAGAPDFLGGALTTAARAQLPAAAFTRFVAGRDATLRAIADEKAYIDGHAAHWPENFAIGRAAYDAMLHDEQLLPFDAAAIERMGEDELAHGWAQAYWIEHLAHERRVRLGATSGGGLAPGGSALIPYYRAQIAHLRQFVVQHHIVDVPGWLGQIVVVETPKFLQPVLPGASMNSPRRFANETNGEYFITPPTSLAAAAARLDPNEDFDRDRILSTAAHEAMPGHFLQLSIARRHPDFVRRIQFSSSFAEGWAYYGEEMFVALGLYGDDLDARYDVAQWERVRGARAVVDAKLASGEMSEPEATAYFSAQTGFSREAAKAAVDGIALAPGYVVAYTAGRQQLELLEHAYFAAMGSRGSLQDFHDRLLCYGTTPLAIVGPELLADLS
ncbi:MAG: DUF885 domain-containing protein, partial [Candidatus Eremiobacteraeota bacterium]|nr:DUF885 domain-containing protein [Candidatus Eremiobacteraeota bacterium]